MATIKVKIYDCPLEFDTYGELLVYISKHVPQSGLRVADKLDVMFELSSDPTNPIWENLSDQYRIVVLLNNSIILGSFSEWSDVTKMDMWNYLYMAKLLDCEAIVYEEKWNAK